MDDVPGGGDSPPTQQVEYSEPERPSSHHRITFIVLGLAALLIVVVAALVLTRGAKSGPKHDLLVAMQAGNYMGMDHEDGQPCGGQEGQRDIDEGAEVVVYDEAGSVVATGALEAGAINGNGCLFFATIHNVGKHDFYAVEVSHRGKTTSSYDELEANGWKIGLTLG